MKKIKFIINLFLWSILTCSFGKIGEYVIEELNFELGITSKLMFILGVAGGIFSLLLITRINMVIDGDKEEN